MLEEQRAHWAKLHTTKMDATAFAEWVNAIPTPDGCVCKTGFMKILKANPPRYDDWLAWGWEIHNAVNFKLGKPEIEWDEACQQWNWNPNKEAENATTEDSS